MIKYKIDIMKTLTDLGYTRQRLREAKVMSQATLQNITDGWKLQTLTEEQISRDPRLSARREEGVNAITLETLNKICIMCNLKIEDVVEIVPTDDEILKYYKVKVRHT